MRKKLVSCILVVCMLLSMLPTMAWAEEASPTDIEQTPAPVAEENASPTDLGKLDIADGSITITASGYTQGETTETYTGDYVISQTGTQANYIHINGGTHNITLNNVNLNGAIDDSDDKKDKGPFFVEGNATVTLTLIGTNDLTSLVKSAALEVGSGSTVTIKVPGGKDNSYGKLVAECTIDRECAAIGGSRWRSAGTVIIKSGTVIANSLVKTTDNKPGQASGIGPGRRQDMERIEITGGVVTVNDVAAMGYENDQQHKVNTLEISGGTVTCSKGISADSYDITGGNIIADSANYPTVSGRTKTTLVFRNDSGMPISNTEVTVTEGANTWTVLTSANGKIVTYFDYATTEVKVTSTALDGEKTVQLKDGKGTVSPKGALDIADGSVVITATGYKQGSADNETPYTGDYVITQTDAATATTNTITVNGIADGKTITLAGVNITAPDGYPAILIASDATIRMAADSQNTLTGGQNHPAIEPLNGKTVTVGGAGDGALNAIAGGGYTAAIGGADGYSYRGCNLNGDSRNFGSVIINGGTITATAAQVNGSAIGSAWLGHIASVTINGGTIYANNDRAVFASGTDGKYGTVVINGGKIVARNVDNAISTGNNGTITIDSNAVITGGAASYNKGGTQYDRTQIKIWGYGAEQKNATVTVTVDSGAAFQTETDENGWISYLYLTHNVQHTINITGADNKTYTTGAFTATAGNVVFAKNTDIADYSEKCTVQNSSIAFDAGVPSSVPMYDGLDSFVVNCPATQSIYAECYAPEHILSYSYEVEQNNAAVADKTQYAELNGTTLTLKRNGDYNVIITATCGSVTASKTITVTQSSVKALNIANGEITVAEGTTAGTVKYQQGSTTVFDNVAPTENVIIVGETTTNRIIVQKSAKITLKDVSITISSDLRRPMQVLDGATLTLWLEGESTLTAKKDHGAGIFVEYGSTLVIDSANGTLKNADISSEHGGDKQEGYAGSLRVTGATSGCGIGWDYWTEFTNSVDERGSGSVTINGGNVTALGGDNSAPYRSNSGIGAGWYNLEDDNPSVKVNYPNGNITINGGNVCAGYVGRGGRGISSGSGDLTITGGVVYAYGGGEGHAGTVGAIHSFGGTITIGSENGTDGDLSLYAATTDTVNSGNKAAAIGGANDVEINILSGTVTAESSGNSAAIGGNNSVEGNVGSITISGGNITTTSKSGENDGTAVGIGVVGADATCPTIAITGGTVNCVNTTIGTNNADNKNAIAVTVSKGAEINVDSSTTGTTTLTAEGGATINGAELPEDMEGTITIPSAKVNDIEVTDGTVTLPAGSVVTKEDNSKVELTEGGTVAADGAIAADGAATITKADGSSVELTEGGTVAADGAITAGGTVTTKDAEGNTVSTVTVPENSTAIMDTEGKVTVPEGTVVEKADGTTTTLPDGGSVANDGAVATEGTTITEKTDGTVEITKDGETTTITPAEGEKVTVNTDSTVTLPEGTTVTKDDGSSVELSEGGTMAADGTITAGGTVTTKDAQGNVVSTVVVPEGKDATVSADGTVTAPAGTTIKQEGKDDVVLDNGGTVDKDGTVTETPVTPPSSGDEGEKPTPQPPYSGGYYPSYTPSVTPAAPSVDSSSLNNAALAVGSAIKDGSAEFTPVNGYTKDEVVKLQKDGKLRLGIEKTVGYGSVADKNLAEAAIKSAGGAVNGVDVMYFDITPVLKLDNGTVVAHVTDTEKAITITIELSDELTKAAKDGKDITVVRVHDGKAEFLSAKLNSAKTKVTFSSADFSTYAVVALNKATSAKTFDAGVAMYVGMAVLAATGSAVVVGKKRK